MKTQFTPLAHYDYFLFDTNKTTDKFDSFVGSVAGVVSQVKNISFTPFSDFFINIIIFCFYNYYE